MTSFQNSRPMRMGVQFGAAAVLGRAAGYCAVALSFGFAAAIVLGLVA